MSLTILTNPDPRLREVASEVTKFDAELQGIAAQMLNTMVQAGGVGLAAPQVGINKRIIVVQTFPAVNRGFSFEVMVNPIVTVMEGALEDYNEGCLSFPGEFVNVKRPTSVTVMYRDIMGGTHTKRFSHIEARIILHEVDHLNGILMTDMAEKQK